MNPDSSKPAIPEGEALHRWVHEQLGAYLAGGLDPHERAAVDSHIHACAACFDAFSEARDADLEVLRRLGNQDTGLTAGPDLEDRLVKRFRETTMKRTSFSRLAGMSIAAAVALAATGVLANHLVRQDRLNNPLTEHLTAQLPGLPPWMSGAVAPTTAPGREALIKFNFERANPETVLDYLAKEGGYQVIKPEMGMTGPPVTVGSASPVTVEQAVEGLNVALEGDGYSITEVGDHTLKVQPIPDMKRLATVQYGADPLDIAGTVSPQSVDAVRLKNNLVPQVTLYDGQRPVDALVRGEKDQAGGQQKLAMSGAGTTTLSGANTFSGTTRITAGNFNASGGTITAPYDYKMAPASGIAGDGVVPSTGVPGTLGGGAIAGTAFGNGGTSGVGGTTVDGRWNGEEHLRSGAGIDNGMNRINNELYTSKTYAEQNILRLQEQIPDQKKAAGGEAHVVSVASGNSDLLRSGLTMEQFASDRERALQGQNTYPAATRPAASSIPMDIPQATTQPAATAPDIAERKVIRNGTVEYEVRSFDDAYQTISSLTTELGGYVSSTSSDRLSNGKIRGTVVVRVPPEKLDRLLLQLRGIGDLKNQQIAANDVTKEYTDTESELRGLRAMEDRMLDLIKNGKGEVKDLVEAEKQLGDYRVRIEKLEGDIRYYNNLVAMATLTITAYEKDIQKAAAATEQETASIDVQTEAVEEKLAAARKLVDDAKGRVIDSGAKKGDNDQITAYLAADIPADKSDGVIAGLRVLGQVVHFERTRKQTLSGGSDNSTTNAADTPGLPLQEKDTRITLTLSNLASVPPRETITVNLAADDVRAAYQAILSGLREGNGAATQPQGAMGSVGRIINSQVMGNRPEDMTGNIQAEVRAESLEKVLKLLRSQGLVLAQNVTQNSSGSATTEKEGLVIQILSAATVPPRETTAITVATADVPALYQEILRIQEPPDAAVNPPTAHPVGRITNSQLTGNKPSEMTAAIQGEVEIDRLAKLLDLIHERGAVLAQSVSQNTNATTMPIKEGLSIQIVSAATIPPGRITTLGIELGNTYDVTRGLDHVRGALPAIGPAGARILEDSVAGEGNGRLTGRLTVDVPVADAMKVLSAIQDLGGDQKVDNVQINADAPDTKYATERISLTLSSRGPIVESNQGIWPTVRAALSSALAALSWSLYLVLTGILFLLPWVLLIWLLRKLWKRRPAAA